MVIVVILVLFCFALLCFWSIHCTYRYVLYRLYKLIEHTSDLTSFDSLNVACELNAGKTGFLFTFYMDVRNIKLRGWLQNPKHDRISIRRIRMLPFFSIPCMTQSLMFYQDLDCQSQERKWKSKLITRPEIEHYDLFLLLLLFPTLSEKCSFHLIISDRVLSRISVQFLTPLKYWFDFL